MREPRGDPLPALFPAVFYVSLFLVLESPKRSSTSVPVFWVLGRL